MTPEALANFKRIWSRLPIYNKNNAGKTVAVVTPDKALTLTETNTMSPGETTWDKVMGKPATFPTTWAQIGDRPPMFDGTWGSLTGKPDMFSGSYADLSDKPKLSALATSGSYSDLTDKPTLFSGAYADLSSLPVLFDGKWSSLSGRPATFPSTWAQVADKPPLFSGSYNDLTNKPAIPALPNLATVASTGSYDDLTAKPTLFNGTWASLTGKPDVATKTDVAAATKRIETYSGTTDANGLYTVTFPTPFSAIPTIQPEPPAMANQVWVKVNATATGFSLRLLQRNVVALLGIEVLLGATVNVANAPARVSVIAT